MKLTRPPSVSSPMTERRADIFAFVPDRTSQGDWQVVDSVSGRLVAAVETEAEAMTLAILLSQRQARDRLPEDQNLVMALQ